MLGDAVGLGVVGAEVGADDGDEVGAGDSYSFGAFVGKNVGLVGLLVDGAIDGTAVG